MDPDLTTTLTGVVDSARSMDARPKAHQAQLAHQERFSWHCNS